MNNRFPLSRDSNNNSPNQVSPNKIFPDQVSSASNLVSWSDGSPPWSVVVGKTHALEHDLILALFIGWMLLMIGMLAWHPRKKSEKGVVKKRPRGTGRI